MIKKWIIKEFFKNNLFKYIVGITALVSSSLLQLTLPKLLGYITDSLKDKSQSASSILWLSAGMLGIALVLFGLKFIFRYFLMGRARDLECFIRAKLFSHLQTLPPKFYNNRKTGDLMAYATNDLGAIRRAFSFGLVFLIDGIIINLTSLVVMVETINPILTIAALTPIIISVFIILKLRRKMREKFVKVQESYSSISEKIQENISGVRVVKAYVQEEAEIEKLTKASSHRMKMQMEYTKLSSALRPIVQVSFGISFTLSLVLGSRLIQRGVITLGDFIAFNTYLGILINPINHIGRLVEVWQRALASIKRLDDIFEVKTDIIEENISFEGSELKGQLEMKNLSFSYPGANRRALKDINISLKAGNTLGIIGTTGSGKTTLINLLLRLFKVKKGHIFIDGVDLTEIPITTLRDNIGCVPQDNFLFSASIKDNIEFFDHRYTDEEIEEASKVSSVYENIVEFPEGFDTVIGERGITLSGGQKQRISIARAVIKDPSILVLDDSLSAVDTKTEEEILSNIKSILKGRTGIVIAHRISTIRYADEIIVMDRGRITERGTHEELLNKVGEYYKLYCAQTAESRMKNLEEMIG
jgi:ATP-binding cassette, subfamily B, multidrug efflux pump